MQNLTLDSKINIYIYMCKYIYIHTYNQEFVGSGFQMMQQYNGFGCFLWPKNKHNNQHICYLTTKSISVFLMYLCKVHIRWRNLGEGS